MRCLSAVAELLVFVLTLTLTISRNPL